MIIEIIYFVVPLILVVCRGGFDVLLFLLCMEYTYRYEAPGQPEYRARRIYAKSTPKRMCVVPAHAAM